jgi:hypothetical protein
MSVALQDQRQQYEAKHDLAAGADVSKITAVPALQDGLLWSLAGLASASQSHALAVAALQDELSDSDRHRIKLQTTRDALWPHYLRVQLNASAALLAPDVDTPLSDADLREREALLDRTFPLTRTDFMRESYEKLWTLFGEVVRVCTSHALLKPLKLAKGLAAALKVYGADLESWQADQREDRDAQAALVDARAALARASTTHERLVLACLTAESREDQLGRYIRTKDAAYAARRRADKPVADEPDPDDLITQPIAEG